MPTKSAILRGRAMSVFLDRARVALARRMYPHSGLHAKQLAHALGKSEDTALRLMRGEAQLSAVDIYSLMRLFGPAFVAEVYEEAAILSPRDRRALELGRKALDMAEAAA